MTSSANARGMPLLCHICPKRPNFSDVSHLLTHAASKGHLSNYYRLKVKSSHDPIAQRSVADYDAWYEEWNLNDLMRERISQKEKKRGLAGHSSRRHTRAAKASSRNISAAAASQAPKPDQHRSHTSHVDPQLERLVKIEPSSRSTTPSSILLFEPAAVNRAFVPPMQQPWVAPSDLTENSLKQESVSSFYSDEPLVVPLPAAQIRSKKSTRRQPSASVISIASQQDDEHEPTATVTDSSKLKGIYWPGMAMFDAALPEARRKRNQKKASSVLEHLQSTSETVEATEFVFDRGGALRKQRVITGHPESEDSLIEGESSPSSNMVEKKRGRKVRPRPVLAEKHPNNGNPLRRRRDEAQDTSYRSRDLLNHPLAYSGIGDEDDDLTYLQSRPKARRTGLSIHRDNSGPEITFERPAAFNVLTASFRDPFRSASENDDHQGRHRFEQYTTSNPSQRLSSWGVNGPFRPAMQGNPNTQNFATFGHYITHSMSHATDHNNIASHHGLPALNQQSNFTTQLTQNDSSLCSAQDGHDNSWSHLFNFDNQDLMVPNTIENTFTMKPEDSPSADLFLRSNQDNDVEDDQATISVISDT